MSLFKNTLIASLCVAATCTYALPPEAERAKERLKLAFQTAESYPHEIRMQVNMKQDFLYSITFAENIGEINGRKEIPIPADLIPIWPLFRQLYVYGPETGALRAEQITPIHEGEMERWWSNEAMICLHSNNLRIDTKDDEGYTLILEGQGIVDKIVLANNNGISPIFDDSPYTTLGANKPIKSVTLSIDSNSFRAIEGICELDEQKFFRLYTEPCRDPEPVKQGFAAYGFSPGRQIIKFAPWLEGGYVKGQPLLKEDPKRPGYADPDYFTNHNPDLFRSEIERGFDAYKTIDEDWPGLKFAMCFDNWPSFMEARHEGVYNSKGTPENYDAAADIAVKLLLAQEKYSGRTPDWMEVKNESDIADEWMFHDVPESDSWKELADFHNAVADGIHKELPHIKVGGPTSVWMMYDNANFKTAKDQLRFMDLTRGHLDFYSHHFYESKSLISKKEYNQGRLTYIHGRGDAVLDLTANHMEINDNVRPIVVTEYGAIHGGMKDMDFWIRLKSCNALKLMFMNRTHQFDLCVPYMLPYMWWDPTDPYGIYVNNADGTFSETKTASFLRLWKGYKGKRIYAETNDSELRTHVLLDGNVIRIAANNLSDRRVALNLELAAKNSKIQEITQRRLYFDSGNLVEEALVHKVNTKEINLAVDETSIIELSLDKAPQPSRMINEHYFYGDTVMSPTGEHLTVSIDCQKDNLLTSKLRIGVGKNGGFENDLKIKVDSFETTIPLGFSKGMPQFYDLIEIDIPREHIKPSNTIEILLPESGGLITSAALLNHYSMDKKM